MTKSVPPPAKHRAKNHNSEVFPPLPMIVMTSLSYRLKKSRNRAVFFIPL
jgi:hypothetical protein